jgi:hypothetical protein
MWTAHHREIPNSLHEAIGLGREPVFSHADQAWYAKSGRQVMRWVPKQGLAAPSSDLSTAANALVGLTQPCDYSSSSAVTTFQTAWNADTATNAGNILSVDGQLGPNTYAALQQVFTGPIAFGACQSGGYTGWPTTSQPTTQGSFTSTTVQGNLNAINAQYPWLLPAVAVAGVGGVGLLAYHHWKKGGHRRLANHRR